MIWERVHDFQLGVESYQQKVNLTAPTITLSCIEKYKVFSIISEPVYGIIYKNSKREKRVIRRQEIHKFYDATLKRVLEGLKSYNNDVKHGYVTPSLSNADLKYLQLSKEEIKEQLKHRDQMRHFACGGDHISGGGGFDIKKSIFSSCYLFRNPFSLTTIGDENPIRTLGDYSKPSHEGYRNTIELPVGNNVYCMKDPEQAFVDYASSCTDEAGGKWYTFKPEQNNIGDTYNLSWKRHPNLRDDGDVMFIKIVKKNDDSRKEEPKEEGLEVEHFDIFLTRDELVYHKYLIRGPIPSIFLRNPIITEGSPSNIKIPCNIRHVHMEKAYIDLNSPLNIMTRMMYNWIMRRKLDPRENSDRGVRNFTARIKRMHVFLGNFTYAMDFMIVEDINSIIDPRLSQVVLGKPFVEISNMSHDSPEGVVRFTNGTDEITYKMPHKIEQYNALSDLEKEHTKSVYLGNEENKRRGVEYVMSKILGFYKECLVLRPEYVTEMDDEGEVT
uniref:Retrotransposon Orf1 n=1 Tax=Tanacetum cinerariifolium TaxID=118510 RepID=A0A6L2KGS1_TANCI|nr:retrotransposon Orf1 [Tanacetum cinerariifolium]